MDHSTDGAVFAIRDDRFENTLHIEERCERVGHTASGAVRTALSYLYCVSGPVNLPRDRLKLALPHLDPAEVVVARWLQPRTNGALRATYGVNALNAARRAKYRCERCGFADVRALNLDHVDGRVAGTPFACLCANCHAIKSRAVDWTGAKRAG